jgi:hypothetical protein
MGALPRVDIIENSLGADNAVSALEAAGSSSR